MLIVVILLIVAVACCGAVWYSLHPASPTSLSEPVIAAGVLTASAHRSVPMAHAIEQAMQQAVMECVARGVSMDDSATIQAAMLRARARVLGH